MRVVSCRGPRVVCCRQGEPRLAVVPHRPLIPTPGAKPGADLPGHDRGVPGHAGGPSEAHGGAASDTICGVSATPTLSRVHRKVAAPLTSLTLKAMRTIPTFGVVCKNPPKNNHLGFLPVAQPGGLWQKKSKMILATCTPFLRHRFSLLKKLSKKPGIPASISQEGFMECAHLCDREISFPLCASMQTCSQVCSGCLPLCVYVCVCSCAHLRPPPTS